MILEHPALSIELVPIEKGVERVEERRVRLAAWAGLSLVRPEIQFIEGRDAETIE